MLSDIQSLFVLVSMSAGLVLARLGCDFPLTFPESTVGWCQFTAGNFSLVCSDQPFYSAQAVCAQREFRLAEVNDFNAAYAQQLLVKCIPSDNRAWMQSWNGLMTPCTAMSQGEAVGLNWFNDCTQGRQPVICETVPVVTESVSVTVTETVTSGTLTTCTRTSLFTQATQRHEDLIVEKANGAGCGPGGCGNPCIGQSPNSCTCCNDVCQVSYRGLYIVKVPRDLPFNEATAVCQKYGWRLADYTSGMAEAMERVLIPGCLQGLFEWQIWIRSVDGVDGGRCVSLKRFGLETVFSFGLSVAQCDQANIVYEDRRVMCQSDEYGTCELAPTGYGPSARLVTTTTTFFNTTTTDVIPETTETLTTVVTCLDRRHNPRGWLRDSESDD